MLCLSVPPPLGGGGVLCDTYCPSLMTLPDARRPCLIQQREDVLLHLEEPITTEE